MRGRHCGPALPSHGQPHVLIIMLDVEFGQCHVVSVALCIKDCALAWFVLARPVFFQKVDAAVGRLLSLCLFLLCRMLCIASSFLLRIVFVCGTVQSYMNVGGNYCLNKHPSAFVPHCARRIDEGLLCCNCTTKRPCATGDCVKPTRVFRDPMWAQTCWYDCASA